MLYALATLFAFNLLGELLVRVSGLPLPGALVGTLLLLIGLLFYKRLPKPLEDTAQVLLQNMMLLFIPVIAGVMLEFDHLRREWLPFVLSCVVGAAVTFTATALTFRFFLQRERAKSTKDEAATGNEQEAA
ncbi:CidA/LrgA family protein [Comamonas fluminis]|uniref:CidA/LrgA family protein n=1 Tax=Comamonas fluminis TaxID=2796366 RepID=UPI001C447F98|nr:CidA/LrgA family protein [Comamonas fluminis]